VRKLLPGHWLELGEVGDTELITDSIAAGASFHFVPGTVHRVTAIEDTTIPDTAEDTVEAETLPPTGTGSGTLPGAPIAALLLVAGGGVVLLVRRRASG